MSISVGGLMSGMDTDKIITQLLNVERQPISLLNKKETDFQIQLSTYGNLQSAMSNLKTALQGLEVAGDFTKYSVSSADTSRFTVTAGSSPVAGSYAITVHQLAQAHKIVSTRFGKSEGVGAGTLTLQLGTGKQTLIDITAGDTIEDVANAINNAQGSEISAGVIFDGTGYFLSLSGKKTGESNLIKMTVTDTGDGNNTDTNGSSRLAYEKGVTENLTQNQAALDSEIDIDGASGITGIKRATNTLTDVISGVTINLVKAHDDPATNSTKLTVTRNTGAVLSAVDGFVKAYNEVSSFISKNQTYDAKSKIGGPLLGDPTASFISRRLKSLTQMNYSGMGAYSTLSDIGITRDASGLLSVNTSQLMGKLGENFDAVVQLFTQTTSGKEGFSVRGIKELNSMLDSRVGSLTHRQNGIQSSIDNIHKDVDRINRHIASSETRMRAQFNSLELLLGKLQTTGNYLTQQVTGLQNLSSAISK